MKITYRVKKASMSRNQPLSGVRVGNQPTPHQIEKRKQEKLKRFDPTRVILTSILLFMVEILVLYLLNVYPVRGSIDSLVSPSSQFPTIVYNTLKLDISDNVPETIRKELTNKLSELEFNGTKRFEFTSEQPDVVLSYSASKSDSAEILATQYLVPVGHLYWVRDSADKNAFEKDEILVPQENLELYSSVIQTFSPNSRIKGVEKFSDALKAQEKNFGITDFYDLRNDLKLLTLDGKYFFEDAPTGGIPYYFTLSGDSDAGKNLVKDRGAVMLPDDFQKDSILSVRMTGVTAITRGLGIKTNASGDPAYAARKIGSWLAKADLTHVSNEVSMVPGCVPSGGVSFCMVTSHLEALKKSGVNIVELTGNHNNDKGHTFNAASIKTYKDLGWDYFGGGTNATDAAKVLIKDVKGSKVAFVGYNYYDTVLRTFAIAGANRAGANSWSPEKIKADVEKARKEGADVVIVTFQYQECWSYSTTGATVQQCYGPIASPNQKIHFRQAVDLGADIVIGTQAHQPQSYEVYKGKVIYYGLGNLYFDQHQWLGTRQGLVLTHYLYKGKYLGTGITTTLYNTDLITYITTGEQRASLLRSLRDWRPKN